MTPDANLQLLFPQFSNVTIVSPSPGGGSTLGVVRTTS